VAVGILLIVSDVIEPIPADLILEEVVPSDVRLCPECLLEQVPRSVKCNSDSVLFIIALYFSFFYNIERTLSLFII
jgi:hypothetical protein